MIFEFVDGGAEDEWTLGENRAAYGNLAFRPRALVDVAKRNLGVTVLGQELRLPVLLAPTGGGRMVGRDGELAAARAAVSRGTVSVLSTGSNVSLEDVAAGVPEPQWFQLYPWGSQDSVDILVRRAKDAGYRVLVVTVDVPVGGARERDQRNGLTVPPAVTPKTAWDVLRHPRWFFELLTGPKVTFANLADLFPETGRSASGLAAAFHHLLDPSQTWADLDRIKRLWDGPVVLKGVMCGQDAQRAVDAGCAGVIVSNHGGRQADGVPATIDVLPEVVAAVGGRADVLLDGGIRRGSDVLKAIALGATACLVGRPWLYGLAAGGQAGVERTLDILGTEMDRTLALIGRASLDDLDPSVLVRRPGTRWQPAASALPGEDK